MWARPAGGAELFDDEVHEAGAVRERFMDWWRQWERQGFRPAAEVPTRLSTTPVGRAGFEVGEARCELRLASVRPEGDEWFTWASCAPEFAAEPHLRNLRR